LKNRFKLLIFDDNQKLKFKSDPITSKIKQSKWPFTNSNWINYWVKGQKTKKHWVG